LLLVKYQRLVCALEYICGHWHSNCTEETSRPI
jgi:hypothetical protein